MKARLDKIRTRLETLAAARVRHAPDPVAAAGRIAEMEAGRQIAKAVQGTGWSVHSALRVTDPRTPEFLRSELDFVVTSLDGAVILELKNWSGLVEFERGCLVQRARRERPEINHGPVFEKMAQKQDVLRRFHAYRRNEPPPPLRSLLVFWHPKVQLGLDLADREDVVFGSALLQQLPRGGRGGGLIDVLLAVLRHLGVPVAPPPKAPQACEAVRALRQTLDECGTWDTLRLNGGRHLAGDFIRLEGAPGCALDRAAAASATVDADRSRIVALLRDPRATVRVRLRDGRSATFDVGSGAAIVFQPAGSERPVTYPALQCDELAFGYADRRPGAGARRSGRKRTNVGA